MKDLQALASKHASDIVNLAIGKPDANKAVVVFDTDSKLADLVTEAYRSALPNAEYYNVADIDGDKLLTIFDTLSPKDLVVLIQSSNFRLNDFRIRIELFKLDIAVIEHVHLERCANDDQMEIYVNSMAYDPEYYRPIGRSVKEQLDNAENVTVHCDGTELHFNGGMEPAKLNIGDYSEMKNVGGTFPIGEVFTESKDFSQLNGEAMIFAFAGKNHEVQIHEPFKITVKEGVLVDDEGPAEFKEIMEQIREQEVCMVREFGVGLNKAFGKDKLFNDITAFERQHGLHFSLGEKHGVYKKPGLKPKKTRYHVDVFVDINRIDVDGKDLVF